LNFFTLPPMAVTRPMISCPGTAGYWAKAHSLREPEVGVADAAVVDIDLNVAFGGLAPRDGG
jgi:hypothetical protein